MIFQKIVFSVLFFQNVNGEKDACSGECVQCPRSWLTGPTKCYKYFNSLVPLGDAAERCRAARGRVFRPSD